MTITPHEAVDQPDSDVTSGSAVFYLNGRRLVRTESSVPVSSSPWLNDARIREWVATESLRRNGHDYPLLYGLPQLMQAVDDVQDVATAERLVVEERQRNPAFDRWMMRTMLHCPAA